MYTFYSEYFSIRFFFAICKNASTAACLRVATTKKKKPMTTMIEEEESGAGEEEREGSVGHAPSRSRTELHRSFI